MCQVKEHEPTDTPSNQPTSRCLGATPWTRKKAHHPKWRYIIDVNDKELKEGIAQSLIPTIIANSAATSGIGTINNPCQRMGKPSHKQFNPPDGTIIPATEIAEHPFEVRKLANILQITPGVSQNLPTFSTSHRASVKTLSLAQSNLQMQTTSQFSTKTQSTSTALTIQSSPSPKEQSYGDDETRTATYGVSH